MDPFKIIDEALSQVLTETKGAFIAVEHAARKLETALERRYGTIRLEKRWQTASSRLQRLRELYLNLLNIRSSMHRPSVTRAPEVYYSPPKIVKPAQKARLVSELSEYVFRTESWRCVTIIKENVAVTFDHEGDLKVGSTLTIYSITDGAAFIVTVIKKHHVHNWVLLRSDVQLREYGPVWGVALDGNTYCQFGISPRTDDESPITFSTGMLISPFYNEKSHILGTAGGLQGDSGGPCFDAHSFIFVGISPGCDNVSIFDDQETGHSIYDKNSSRYVDAKTRIFPIRYFNYFEFKQ